MFSRAFVSFILIKFACAQLSDFFWLNDEFTSYAGFRPPPPKVEDINDLDSDESARILFRDDNLVINKLDGDDNKDLDAQGQDIIIWPYGDKLPNGKDIYSKISDSIFLDEEKLTSTTDKFVIKFPDDIYVFEDTTNSSKSLQDTKRDELNIYKESIDISNQNELSVNICKYMTKSECYFKKGAINKFDSDIVKDMINDRSICCILPLKNSTRIDASPLYLTDDAETVHRDKRSEDIAQKQRNILLKRKYAHANRKPKLSTPSNKKVATDYEYDDPYWNIKNVKTTIKQKPEPDTRYSLHSDEYPDDYTAEIPNPGLTSINSNNDKKPIGWTVSQNNKGAHYGVSDDYEVEDSGYRHSTIDPRIGNEKHRKPKPRVKTARLTTTTEEPIEEVESLSTNYQAYPDYSVAQDFKMLNFLKKAKKKGPLATKTTTERFSERESQEDSSVSGLGETNKEMSLEEFKERQIFKNCGKCLRPIPAAMKRIDKQIADTENGSHPWLALLVPTRKLNNLLCYASLIHPRAALSAADCVYRSMPREVTLIIGLCNLNERSRLKSRIVSVLTHPKYTGGLSNNLAILHWKRPLRLGINVQPVCLSKPRYGHECIFVGWGGFDQGIHSRARWQRATIHPCNDRLSLNGVGVPPEAFCASVEAGNTVTGFGGSLVCNVLGHLSAVGVAVSRDSALVLLPAHDWVNEAITILRDH